VALTHDLIEVSRR